MNMKSNKIKIQMKLNKKKNLVHKTNNIFCPTKQKKNTVWKSDEKKVTENKFELNVL